MPKVGGKNTSVIHEAIPLIQLLLTISNPEVILCHREPMFDIRLWRTLDITNQHHVLLL